MLNQMFKTLYMSVMLAIKRTWLLNHVTVQWCIQFLFFTDFQLTTAAMLWHYLIVAISASPFLYRQCSLFREYLWKNMTLQ